MDAQILHNGVDISTDVISYTREQQICSGIGNINVQVKITSSRTFTTYDTIVLYENGTKKGTYYVASINRSLPNSTITLVGQDGSKWLQDYFIDNTYNVYDNPTTCRYWLEFFLDMSGISYSINTDETGTLVTNQTVFGFTDANSVITQLLQQSGWYLYFDADNVAQIGPFLWDVDGYDIEVTDTEITNIDTSQSDEMFRNRVVVYGQGNPALSSWVHAEIDETGRHGMEYDGVDTRSIVIANGYISTDADALGIASIAIKEFTKPNYTVAVDVIGPKDFTIGQRVHVNSKYVNFVGVITTIGSELSQEGYITHLVINQRCPRLFSFFDFGGSVYVGTDGNGVWRKYLAWDHTWTDFSTGIPAADRFITDLKVDSGCFVCIGNKKIYYRTINSNWAPFNPGSFTDPDGDVHADCVATGCNINPTTKNIIALYSDLNHNKSWYVELSAYGVELGRHYVKAQYGSVQYDVRGFDIATSDGQPIITALTPGKYYRGNISRNTHRAYYPVNSINSYNTITGITENADADVIGSTSRMVMAFDNYVYYINDTTRIITREDTLTETEISIDLTPYMNAGDSFFSQQAQVSLLTSDIAYLFFTGIKEINFSTGIVTPLTDVSNSVYTRYFAYTPGMIDKNGVSHIFWNGTSSGGTSYHFLYSTYSNGVLSDPVDITPAQEANCRHYRGFPERFWAVELDSGILGWLVYQDWNTTFNTTWNDSRVAFKIQNGTVTLNRFLINIGSGSDLAPLSSSMQMISDNYSNCLHYLTRLSARNKVLKVDMNLNVTKEVDVNTNLLMTSSNEGAYYVDLVAGDVINFTSGLTVGSIPANSIPSSTMDEADQGVVFLTSSGALYYDIKKLSLDTSNTTTVYTNYLKTGLVGDYPTLMGQYFVTGNQALVPLNPVSLESVSSSAITARYSAGIYYVQDFPTYSSNMDISMEYPVITWGMHPTDYRLSGISISGTLYSGGVMPNFFYTNYRIGMPNGSGLKFYYPVTNLPSGYMYDSRSFRELSASGMGYKCLVSVHATISGYMSNVYVIEDNLTSFDASVYTTFSGQAQMIETTNSHDMPYVFVSVSGDRNRFYQKDGNSGMSYAYSGFVDRTANLPNFRINVIRCDDLL